MHKVQLQTAILQIQYEWLKDLRIHVNGAKNRSMCLTSF